MIVVVIVGARTRSAVKNKAMNQKERDLAQGDDRFLLRTLLAKLAAKYRSELAILSCACDDGVGLLVKDICGEMRIRCGELMWYFHGDMKWEQKDTAKCYLSRGAAYMEMGDLFIILSNENRQGINEDLVERLQGENTEGRPRPYIVFDEKGGIIDEHLKAAIVG